jgi:methylmalonyl-CoA decarboxylase
MGKRKNGPESHPEIVLTETRANAVGIITMNNSAGLNCLGKAMVQKITAAVDKLVENDCRVIVIRAARGAKVWSAGLDIKELPGGGRDPFSPENPFPKLIQKLENCPVPIMAMLEGSVWGGACHMAVLLDILVGTPETTFAMTPAKLGLPYTSEGLAPFIGALPLHVIKQMLFTAKPLSAQDALGFGLLNKMVPANEIEQATMKIAGEISACAPLAVRVLKAEMKQLAGGRAMSSKEFKHIQQLRETALHSDDLKEGLKAFLKKRLPVFKGK